MLKWWVGLDAMSRRGGQARKFPGIRVLIFDLDGTLIDSSQDLAAAVNMARGHMGLPPLSLAQVMTFIGNGARELVRRGISFDTGSVSDAAIDRALGYFREHYSRHLLDQTRPYPGVREALEFFSQQPATRAPRTLAVLTNKPLRFTRPILEGLGLAPCFRYIYGEDSFPTKKPDPAGALSILRDAGAAPHEAMLIGDSEIDVQTARNAGTWACGVTYGLGSARLADCPPDMLLDSLAELPACLD